MATKKADLLDIVQKILKLDSKMRFAAIIDPKGNIREAIMKTGKTSLKKSKRRGTFLQTGCTKKINEKRI